MTDLSRFDGHSEGPWQRSNSGCKTPIDNGEKHIAMINYNNNGHEMSSCIGTEHEANVELIVAAPALLARVKELEEALEKVADEAMDCDSPQFLYIAERVLNKDWL